MKKLILILAFVLLFSLSAFAEEPEQVQDSQTSTIEQTQSTAQQQETETAEQPPSTQENAELKTEAGITPDSPLYIFDDLAERISVGNNPEKALKYREEKIAEAREMVEKGKPDEARETLDKALKYGDILEREVSPEIKERVEESAEAVRDVIDKIQEKTEGEEWKDVNDDFDKVREKEKKIGTAAELASKIKELCDTLAKLDPIQYADSCGAKDSSPRWMKERDKQLNKEQEEQARVFFDKLSVCFENPKNCDCKGFGVQKFEDYCLEKSSLAAKCQEGNNEACKSMETGEHPDDLLPDYLADVFREVENKYNQAKFDNFMPEECQKANARSPEECNKIMFKLNAPQECIDAGITGETREDELKCRKLMFEKNTPEECIKAGIKADDKDAPRKCASIMFQQNAPQECIDAGLTGESREDEKKCRELMNSKGESKKQEYKPKFNKDCNSVQDTAEKVKCYEEFYNNAQFQVRDDFREREMKGEPRESREFAAKMGAKNPDMPCPDGVCDNWEKEHPNDCPEDCGGERRSYQGECQSQEQIERLKQDCKNRGEDAIVEDRGGCPWVVCVGGRRESYQQQPYQQQPQQPYQPPIEQQPQQQIQPPIEQTQQQPQQPMQTQPIQPVAPTTQPAQTTTTTTTPTTQETTQPTTTTTTQETTQPTTTPTTQETTQTQTSGITGGVISGRFADYWFGR